jgi:hypothetical protein
MSFVQREIERLRNEMISNPKNARYPELYAAQQALAWSLEPTGFSSPFDMITTDIRVNSEDYRAEPHPPRS